MRRPGRETPKGKVLAVLAIVAALVAFLPHRHAGFALRLGRDRGHAVLDLGLASIRIAFDFGRSCPDSNSCRGSS